MGLVESSPVGLSDYQEYGRLPLQGGHFPDETQNLDGLLGYEEMMAVHNF
jgi:hypothetical protein